MGAFSLVLLAFERVLFTMFLRCEERNIMNMSLSVVLTKMFSEASVLSSLEYHNPRLKENITQETRLSWFLENYGILYSQSGFLQMYWKHDDLELHYQTKTALKEKSLYIPSDRFTKDVCAAKEESFIPDWNMQYEGQLRVIQMDEEKTYRQADITQLKDNTHWQQILEKAMTLLHRKNLMYRFGLEVNSRSIEGGMDYHLQHLVSETILLNPSNTFWLHMLPLVKDDEKIVIILSHLVYDCHINPFKKEDEVLEKLEQLHYQHGFTEEKWLERKEKIQALLTSEKQRMKLEVLLDKQKKSRKIIRKI